MELRVGLSLVVMLPYGRWPDQTEASGVDAQPGR